MDSRTTTHSGGLTRTWGFAWAAVLSLVVVVCCEPLIAERPPSIQVQSKVQTLKLVDPRQPAVFPEQSWKLIAPSPFGPTVTIWSVEPFRNQRDPSMQVDAQIELRIGSGKRGRKSDWEVIVPHDRTDFRGRRNLAEVMAGTFGGNGDAGITVSFLVHEQPLVAEGFYETTVVGTITESY